MDKISANDGVKIAYRKLGSGNTPVMLIHGWMVSGIVHRDLMESLSDLQMVAPDLRGTGESDKPQSGFTIDRYAQDVMAVADALDLKKFVVFGHSMGGQIAQWIAATYPDRVSGLMVGCSVPASGMQLPDQAVELFANSGGNKEAQRTILTMSTKKLPPAWMDALLDDAAKISPACIRESFDSWRKASFADKLSAVRAPTLAVATDDPFLPPDFLRAEIVNKISGARLAVLPGPGHYLQIESPKETAALLSAFVAGLR